MGTVKVVITVAVVEDDDAVLDAIRLALSAHGWAVAVYTAGPALLADLDRIKPDCILIDPHLPQMNGAELARSIIAKWDIPFIGLTARPHSPITMQVANHGAHSILTKPATAEQIVAEVLAAIGGQPGSVSA